MNKQREKGDREIERQTKTEGGERDRETEINELTKREGGERDRETEIKELSKREGGERERKKYAQREKKGRQMFVSTKKKCFS
jgi:hypothetical protein